MLLGLQRGQADVTEPLIQLVSDVRPRSHWRDRNPQVSLDTCDVNCGYWLPKNPQMGVWVDNPHFPLAINFNLQRSRLTIQSRQVLEAA